MNKGFFKRLFLKLLLPCLFLTSVPLSDEVRTTGTGFTRDAALYSALKHGLESKIKTYIHENSYTKNIQLINREFIDSVYKYLLNSEVVSINEHFSCFQIEVLADIDNLKLKRNLTSHGFTLKSISKPGIVILIDEYHNDIKMTEQTATLTLKEILSKNGYIVLDVNQQSSISEKNTSNNLHTSAAAQIGFENSADLIIRGIVSTGKASQVDVYGKKQVTMPVQMNVEVIRTDNLRIIASSTHTTRKNAANEFSALQIAIKSAAEMTGKVVVTELDKFCESEEYSSRDFELIINGIDYAQAGWLESNTNKIPCVKNIKLRYLENQKAVYTISLYGSLVELRKELFSGNIPGLRLESMNNGKIIAAFSKDSLKIVPKTTSSDVEINSFYIEELYPSKLRYYAKQPVGSFILNCPVTVSDVHVSLALPELMKQPFQITRNHFDPGDNKIDLYVIPDFEKLVNVMQTRIIQGELLLQYSIADIAYTRSLSIPVTIYGINNMSWDHPEAVSGFITNDDPVIRLFSRKALQELPSGSEYNRDLVNAIAIYEAVRKYGIQYVKDPLPASGKLIDMVQYPVQTLSHRTGDCDDLSVLYCSLLSSLGIPVSLLSYDNHVFFMFSTGIFEKNRLSLSPDTSLTIIHDKKLWIPVESTDMYSSFVENWHSTARKFHDAIKAGRKVEIIDIQKAWKLYPPVSLFTNNFDISLKPVKAEVEAQLKNLKSVTARQYIQETARLKSLKKKDISDPAGLNNKIGLLHVRSGDYQKAISFFKKAHHINQTPKLLSNYANALFLSGNEKEALNIFNEIYNEDSSGKIAMNRALCKYVSSRDSSGIQDFYDYLVEAVSVIQSNSKLSEILGFDVFCQDSLREFGTTHHNDKQKLDINILSQYIKSVDENIKHQSFSGITTESSSGTRITGTTTETSTGTTADNTKPKLSPFGGLRGTVIEDLLKLVDLLYWFDLID